MTQLILVRHGQTEWNQTERFRCRADVPLNDTGLQQAEATGQYIARLYTPVAIYAGPLSRTVKTAGAIAKHFGLPVLVEPSLIDLDCGQWQGLTIEEVKKQWPIELQAWYDTPKLVRLPGGETLEEARSRAMSFVRTLLVSFPEEAVVLVSHTALNRVILLSVLGLGIEHFWSLGQDTCGVNIIEARQGHFTVVSMNNTGHLLPLTLERGLNRTAGTV